MSHPDSTRRLAHSQICFRAFLDSVCVGVRGREEGGGTCLCTVTLKPEDGPSLTKNLPTTLREDAVAPGISEQTSLRADASPGLLERSPSASTVTTTKSRLPMSV